MKSLIKTCLVKHKRIVSLTKSTFCTAVILSLAFTANLSAAPTIFLDADTLAADNYPTSSPLIFATSYGDITFVGEIKIGIGDPNFGAVGASGGTFDILGPDDTPAQTAELSFNFDVVSLEFIYGGNTGSIYIEARDEQGNEVVSFYQSDTGDSEPAGPITLSGPGIRSLYWTDTLSETGYAPLDNITVTLIPSPSAVVLAGIGVSFVFGLRKRKIV